MMFSSAIVFLALAASVLANIYITSPVASSTLTAGQPVNLTWQDDGNPPSLAQFSTAYFGIYVGNALEQTLVQPLAIMGVSDMSSFMFTPNATVGPDSNEYFIRVTSLSLMNPSSPQYPAEAFSAKFTLTGMSGSFNSSVQAEINGQSTAPVGPTSASGAPTATGMTSPTTAKSASSASSATSSTKATSTNGAGKPTLATGFVALVAALIGASLL